MEGDYRGLVVLAEKGITLSSGFAAVRVLSGDCAFTDSLRGFGSRGPDSLSPLCESFSARTLFFFLGDPIKTRLMPLE